MNVHFLRGFLKLSSLVVTTLVILACTGTDVQAGFGNWSSAGPAGKVHSLAVATGGSPVYAGGNGSIYKSSDGGSKWTLSLAGPVIAALGNGIVFKPGDTTTAYAAASNGIYKTSDSGSTWSLLSGSPAKGRGGLATDPANVNDLYVATGTGIYKSGDGGATWNNITTGITPADITAVAVYSGTVYVGTAGSGVWSKPTASGSWANISNSAPLTTAAISYLTVDPAGKVYALSGSSIYATSDNGATPWAASAPFTTGDTPVVLLVDSASVLFAGVVGPSNPGIFKTVNGGSTWGLAATGIGTTGDCFSLALQPDNHLIVYAGKVNGVRKSTDGFTGSTGNLDANTGLHLPSIKSFAQYLGYYAGGGEGVWNSTNLTSWTFIPFSGPREQQVSAMAAAPGITSVFAGIANLGSFQTYKHFNTSWTGATNKSGGYPGTDVAAMANNGTNTYMAAVGDGVYWWDNTNTAWQFTGAAPGNTNITGLAAFGTNLYLSTKGGGIFLSNDAGISWVTPATPPASGNISAIRVSTGDGTQLLAGSADGAASKLFKSTDSGSTWIAGALLPSDVTAIDINPEPTLLDTAVIGTRSNGAFITFDGGLTVQPYSSGLPAYGSGFAGINSVNFDSVTLNRVMIGLEGGGLAQRSLTPEITTTPVAIAFSTLPVGSIATKPLTISNVGTLPLVISSISLSTAGPYTLGPGTCGSLTPTIAPGQNCSLDVTFSPTIASTFGNGINISSNAPVSLVSVSLSGTASGAGADISWTGGAGDGKWSSPNNWTPTGPPASTHKVAITLDGTYTVTVDTPATVAELIVGGTTGTQTLSLPASALTVTAAAYFNSRSVLSLSGGTLDGAGQVDLYGTLNWNGTIKGSGVFNLQAGATGIVGTSPNSFLDTKTFNNYGTVTYSGTTANSLQFYNAAIFNNYGTFVTQSFGSLIDAGASGSTFNNLAGALFQKTLDTNTTAIDMPFNNNGALNVKTGTISLNKASSHSGSGALDSGTTLAMAGLGTHNINSGASFSGLGTLSFSGTSTIALNTDLTNTVGAITISDATVNGPGKLVNASGKSLTLAKATVNAAVDNSGAITATGNADSTINGALTTFSGSTLTVDAVSGNRTLTVASGFNNYGTIALNSSSGQWSATLAVTSGTLTNTASANINALTGSGGANYRYLNAQLNNQGTITASWPLFVNRVSAAHSNSGTINVNDNVTITQSGATPSFTNTGVINVAAAKSLTVSGGAFNHNSGTLQGTGSLALPGATFTSGGAIHPNIGGAAGLFSITGSMAAAATGSLNFDIGGTTVGSQYDQLSVSGAATLTGTLNVSLINSFVPNTGDSFTVMTCGSGCDSGPFTTINLPVLTGKTWNLAATPTSLMLTVTSTTSTSQTITFTPPASATYGTPPLTLNATASSGLPVTYGIDSGPGSISGNTLTVTGTGTIQVRASQAGDSTYSAAAVVASIVVNPAPLIVTANSQSKVYGAADPALTYAATGFVGSDTTAIITGGPSRAAGESVGAYAIGQGTLSAGSNYTITCTGANLTITPAPLTVTANSQTKVYGAADPALTYAATGFVLSDTAAVMTGSQSRAAGETVGSYAINQGTISAGSNYTITYTGANLTVLKATPVITWATPADITYGTALSAAQLNATSGAISGTLLYSPASGTQLNAGSSQPLTVSFTPSDTVNYAVPAPLTVTINVLKASQTIGFGPPPTIVVGGSGNVSATATSTLPVGYGSLTASVCTVNGNTVTGIAAGVCTIAADQGGNGNYTAAPEATQSFTVNSGTFTITLNGSGLTGPTRVAAGATANYAITASAGYQISTVTGCGGTLNATTYTTAPITADCSVNVTYSPIAYQLGDALLALQFVTGDIAGLSPQQLIQMDLAPLGPDGKPIPDGKVDLGDVIVILRRYLGLASW